MKKKVLILFFPTKKEVFTPFDHLRKNLIKREMQMLEEIPQNKVNIYLIRNINHLVGENIFIPQFQLNGSKWEPCNSKDYVYGDLVYGFRMPTGISHTYPSKMRDITIDKQIIEKLFPKYTFTSFRCNTYKEIQKYFHNISSHLKVLKPFNESLGRGIFIQGEIPGELEMNPEYYPYLLQDFLDTSGGFYGICKGLHDFRVIILNGKIIAKILREPPEGEFISNTHTGGQLTDIYDFSIPKELMGIIHKIDKYCEQYEHRYYSIDFGIGKNGDIKVFEMNAAPAYPNEYVAREFGKYTAKYILQVT